MLSADLRAARALMEIRVADASGRTNRLESGRLPFRAPSQRPGHWLVRRLALLLVSSGGKLVRLGLPPYLPNEASTRA